MHVLQILNYWSLKLNLESLTLHAVLSLMISEKGGHGKDIPCACKPALPKDCILPLLARHITDSEYQDVQ